MEVKWEKLLKAGTQHILLFSAGELEQYQGHSNFREDLDLDWDWLLVAAGPDVGAVGGTGYGLVVWGL